MLPQVAYLSCYLYQCLFVEGNWHLDASQKAKERDQIEPTTAVCLELKVMGRRNMIEGIQSVKGGQRVKWAAEVHGARASSSS